MTQEANNSQRFCQPWVSLGLQFGLCGLGGWSNGWGSMGPGAGCGTAGVLGGVTGAADLGLGSLAGGGTGWLVFGPGMVGIVVGCWLAAGWSGLCAGMGPVHGAGGANPGDLTVAFTLESTGNGGLGALGAGVAGAFCMVGAGIILAVWPRGATIGMAFGGKPPACRAVPHGAASLGSGEAAAGGIAAGMLAAAAASGGPAAAEMLELDACQCHDFLVCFENNVYSQPAGLVIQQALAPADHVIQQK